MSKQLISIIEFPELYNVLYEIRHLFKFDIDNYKKTEDFINKSDSNNHESSIIISKINNKILVKNEKINKYNILIFDRLPLRIERLLDKINISLIKKKYHFQSSIIINGYDLNLNSRTICKKDSILKLTEKEIEIILFLNNESKAKSVSELQEQVWGYTSELETHTVETHIYRLRKKINIKFNDNKFIVSNEKGYLI
tara:strand:- start:843 stop:1433 length:591 start_codon:yes stop_codon:yes gene_type:complete